MVFTNLTKEIKMSSDKITLDSISRADLHKLVIDLQKRVDELEERADGMQDIVENLVLPKVK